MSPVIFKMVQRITQIALGKLMSARTTGTTVICLGDMCWLIRQFDIKPRRILRNQSVQEWYKCCIATRARPGQSLDQTSLVINDRMGASLRENGREHRRYHAAWRQSSVTQFYPMWLQQGTDTGLSPLTLGFDPRTLNQKHSRKTECLT